jgi:hypothetical protein
VRTDGHRGARVTVRENMLGLFLRGVLAVAIIAAGLVVGAQLRVAREQLATGQAASAGTPMPTTQPMTPAPKATAPTSRKPQPTAPPALRTVVPTPISAPYTGVLSVITGTVTAGGKPLRGAQVMVYPSNSFNHGPTPMPPESAQATTDDRGSYHVSVPPGAYRIGAFRHYDNPVDQTDGFAGITWYGEGYAIGFGKDLVASGNASVADIAMLKVFRVAGRVVGRDGIGVPNAQVGLSRFYGGIDFPLVPTGLSSTDQTGAFSLSIAAMPLTLRAGASGRSATVNASASMDLDLRADRTDLVLTIDRGNIVSGILRDAAGRPLPNTNFGIWSGDSLVNCASCGGRSDGAGRFTITMPNATVSFRNWAQPNEPDLRSKEYVISGDLSLDPVLQSP